MSLVQQGIEKGLISISEDNKTIKYIHQNKSRNYSNPEEKVQAKQLQEEAKAVLEEAKSEVEKMIVGD